MATEDGDTIELTVDNCTLELTEDEVRDLLKSIAKMTHGFDMMLDTLKWCIRSVDHQIYHELNLIQARRHLNEEAKCSTSTDTTSSAASTDSATQLRLPDMR